MSTEKQRPVDHVKDFTARLKTILFGNLSGPLKTAHWVSRSARNLSVAIWKHEGKDGKSFYQISPTERRYRDDQGDYQSSTSLSGTQILQSSRLQDLAYARIRELEAADYAAPAPD